MISCLHEIPSQLAVLPYPNEPAALCPTPEPDKACLVSLTPVVEEPCVLQQQSRATPLRPGLCHALFSLPLQASRTQVTLTLIIRTNAPFRLPGQADFHFSLSLEMTAHQPFQL